MEKVLILSCSTGQGHNSCAQAVKEYFEAQGVSCDFRDSFQFISDRFARFISWGHSFIYRRLPGLFRWGYDYGKNHPAVFHKKSGIYKLLTAGAEHMYQYLFANQFDTVICTHIFSAIMLTHMLRKHPLAIKTAFVATDYTCHPGMDMVNMQYYFIPHVRLTIDFAACGIPKERMIVSGIPVQRSFLEKTDRNEAKRRFNIPRDHKHLLVMCGSMGCGPITAILAQLAPLLSDDTEVSVICGTNKQLYNKLRHRYQKNSGIHIVGYTDQVPLYMDASDLYLTKPGGISITEAASKRLPMVFVKAVAGCEQYNMDFFTDMGAAVFAELPRLLAAKCIRLLHSETDREYMEWALREYQRQDGAKNIFQALNRSSQICEKQR